METIKELEERFLYLKGQLDIKKLGVEKALKELESICKQIQDIQIKIKSLNEVKDSSV